MSEDECKKEANGVIHHVSLFRPSAAQDFVSSLS